MQYRMPISYNYCSLTTVCVSITTAPLSSLVPIQYTPLVDASIGSEESASVVLHLTLSRHMPSEAERAHIHIPVLASLLATKVTTKGGKLSCNTCMSQQWRKHSKQKVHLMSINCRGLQQSTHCWTVGPAHLVS